MSQIPNRVVLVGCGSAKKEEGVHEAKDLYTSNYFQLKRKYAEVMTPDYRDVTSWYILSAKHYTLTPSTEIEPYDVSISDLSDFERGRWSVIVTRELTNMYLTVYSHNTEIVVLAGKDYAELLDFEDWRDVRYPFQECSGIGEQMQWMKQQIQQQLQRNEMKDKQNLEPFMAEGGC